MSSLTWTVNFIALVLAGGPSIALPVGRDALDGSTPTRKLPRGAAELCKRRKLCFVSNVIYSSKSKCT